MSIYTESVQVPFVGWSAEELFMKLQELSGSAVSRTHATGEELKPLGLMWVVIRYDIFLFRALLPGETLRFETWAGPFRHRMSQRNYLAHDEAGNMVLRGAGIWAIVDRISRSMVDSEEYGLTFPVERERVPLPRPALPEKSDALTELGFRFGSTFYCVREEDLDINGHMNNTRCFRLASQCISPCHNSGWLKRARVSYHNEALRDETLQLNWEVKNRSEGPLMNLEATAGGKEKFRMTMEYSAVDATACIPAEMNSV